MTGKLKALLAMVIPAVVAGMFLAATPAAAATLTQVTNFGTNPSNLNMYIYVPDNVAARPALLVAMHYCTGSASAIFNGGAHDYVTAADQYGYIIVFPEVTRSGQCFDVYSPQALQRGGGSDPVGIISMVNWAKSHYNVDPARVFATGFSSGAMMTNVMAAGYPDVFAAGSAFMGVPATCFATGSGSNTWNSQCANGQISRTPQQWGDAARAMYPGYTGRYPRMQLWHGTADTTLYYANFGEEIKQWTNLDGVSQTPVLTDHPQSSWTRTRYGSSATTAPVEGISVNGVGHSLPLSGMVAYAVAFFGLNSAPPPSTAPPTTAPPTTAPPTTPPPTTAPPTTPPPTGQPGTCTATYRLVNNWGSGFQGEVTVKNNGSSTLNGWTVRMTLASGQSITQLWSGVNTGTSGVVTVRNASYNGTLGANASTTFGFTANGNGSTAPGGVSCTSP